MKPKYILLIAHVVLFAVLMFFVWYAPAKAWVDEVFFADGARSLAQDGVYFSPAWHFGNIMYQCLYNLLTAGWFCIFGFGFKAMHALNVVLITIVSYFLSLYLTENKQFMGGYLALPILLVFSPIMFWIINCCRTEVLSMLLGLITLWSVSRLLDRGKWQWWLALFCFSIMLWLTSVQAMIFTTVSVIVLLVVYRVEWKRSLLTVGVHFGGYITGVIGTLFVAWRQHHLKMFVDMLFSFSATISKYYVALRTAVKTYKHTGHFDFHLPQASASSAGSSFFENVWTAYTAHTEYWVLLLVLLAILILLRVRRVEVGRDVRFWSWTAIVMPLVFSLAGRFPVYYFWASYIPLLMAIGLATASVRRDWLMPVFAVLVVVHFSLSTEAGDYKRLDFKHTVDNYYGEKIAQIGIDDAELTVVPYTWYYYIMPEHKNVIYQASGNRFEPVRTIIIDSENDYQEPHFLERFRYQRVDTVGIFHVYRDVEFVLGDD